MAKLAGEIAPPSAFLLALEPRGFFSVAQLIAGAPFLFDQLWTKAGGVEHFALDANSFDLTTLVVLVAAAAHSADADAIGGKIHDVTKPGAPKFGPTRLGDALKAAYWSSTAIIVVWDDWGGWYDHERPTIEAFPQGGYQMGFRVPLIVVSAYTARGFISNSPEDFCSVVRFIERNFGILEGALTFADARGAGDLTEFFSLGTRPHRFQAAYPPGPHILTSSAMLA